MNSGYFEISSDKDDMMSLSNDFLCRYNRQDKSLGLLTKRFVSLLMNSPDGTIHLNQVRKTFLTNLDALSFCCAEKILPQDRGLLPIVWEIMISRDQLRLTFYWLLFNLLYNFSHFFCGGLLLLITVEIDEIDCLWIIIFQAVDLLQVEQKRRIYDITNVLEGIGLLEKKTKNTVQWRYVYFDLTLVELRKFLLRIFISVRKISTEFYFAT